MAKAYNSIFSGSEIDSLLSKADRAVLSDAMNLTSDEKKIARSNIEAELAGTAKNEIALHNKDEEAHEDIRKLIEKIPTEGINLDAKVDKDQGEENAGKILGINEEGMIVPMDAPSGGSGGSGEPGADGYSPTATVEQTSTGATITITDKNGTTTATVKNGKDGSDGEPGNDGGYYTPSVRSDENVMVVSFTPSINGMPLIPDQIVAFPESGVSTVTDAVRYTSQTLTDEQKLQAQMNIDRDFVLFNTIDNTPLEITEAVQAGRPYAVSHTHSSFGLLVFTNFSMNVDMSIVFSSAVLWLNGVWGVMELIGYLDTGSWEMKVSQVAEYKDIPSIPSALKNPYALTINGTIYDGSRAVNLSITGGSGGSGDNIPDYVRTEAERVAKVVQSRQNANSITFLACSDMHYQSPDITNPIGTIQRLHDAITHMGYAMGIIRERVHIDFAVMLGDMVRDYEEINADEVMMGARYVNSCLHKAFSGIPSFRAEGNHDKAYDSAKLTAEQVFANIQAWNVDVVHGDRAVGYCYRDFDSVKLRVICLNTTQVTSGSSLCISSAQATWLAKALDLSEKGAGWRSFIMSHHPLDYGRKDGSDPIPVINAASGLIGAVHGHVHGFKVDTITGTSIKRFAIPEACCDQAKSSETSNNIEFGEGVKYSKTENTAEDTAFCVVTIDLAQKKIYADHYGAGYSRVIPYDDAVLETHTITYQLTNVTSSSSATSVEEGRSYSTTLTASDGYAIESVRVTMGGTDITSTAYSGGKVNITSITGNIVITATAVESSVPDEPVVNYTNLVPNSQTKDSTAIYGDDNNQDGKADGYKNGWYCSDNGNDGGSGTKTGYCVTGFIPYDDQTIEIKGVTFDLADSYCRWYSYHANKSTQYSTNGTGSGNNNVTTFFTVEKLDTEGLHWRLTPKAATNAEYYRMSFKGDGANLIITHNQPIE